MGHPPPAFIFLVLGDNEKPALYHTVYKVYVPCLAFCHLCINVKLSLSDNTVMLMSLFYFLKCCSVTIFVCLSPIDRDDVFAPYPHPPFCQCVLNQ